MKNVVAFDRGQYWEVIADYSGSPRYSSLPLAVWKKEYEGPSFAKMRASQVGAIAMMASKGVGKWKKDWSGPFIK